MNLPQSYDTGARRDSSREANKGGEWLHFAANAGGAGWRIVRFAAECPALASGAATITGNSAADFVQMRRPEAHNSIVGCGEPNRSGRPSNSPSGRSGVAAARGRARTCYKGPCTGGGGPMPKLLTDAQIARYREAGYLAPIRVIGEAEAARLRGALEAVEGRQGGPLGGG